MMIPNSNCFSASPNSPLNRDCEENNGIVKDLGNEKNYCTDLQQSEQYPQQQEQSQQQDEQPHQEREHQDEEIVLNDGISMITVDGHMRQMRKEADMALNHCDYHKAIALYTRIVAIMGNYTETSFRASIYCNRAIAYFHLEWYEKAAVDAERSSNFDPKWFKPYYIRGICCHKTLRLEEGNIALRKMLGLDRSIRIRLPSGLCFGNPKGDLVSSEDILHVVPLKDCAVKPLPLHWVTKESRTKQGNVYYYNLKTRKRTWNPPSLPRVKVLHKLPF